MKSKSISKNKFIVLWISVILLFSLFASLTIYLAINRNRIKTQLENTYKSNFYSLVQNVDDLQVDMSKLIATSSSTTQKKLLLNICTTCSLAVDHLSNTPVSSLNAKGVNNFFNMLYGYFQSLITKLDNNQNISENDFTQIDDLFDKCGVLLYDINKFLSGSTLDYQILNDVSFTSAENSTFSAGIASGDIVESNLPTLIFDGPFAESVVAKEVKGLSDNLLTRDECYAKVEKYLDIYENYIVSDAGETNGKIETYNFNLKNQTHNLYVQIAKYDGLLINITSYGKGGTKNLSIIECENLALNTAKLFGFDDDLKMVWGIENGNIVYINLAPIVDDVVFYPDLIKVKIDKNSGMIVGWDAVNYAYNHIEREAFSQAIGIIDGSNLLNSSLQIDGMRKVIIPNEFSGESYAFEYVCSWNDYVYYIYLDSKTGKELKIMRMVSTSSGDLLI